MPQQAGYTVLFDLLDRGFPWWVTAPIFFLAVVGAGVAAYPEWGSILDGDEPRITLNHRRSRFPRRRPHPGQVRLMGVLFAVFAFLVGALGTWGIWQRYSQLAAAYSGHRYVIVEGVVGDVHLSDSHTAESFRVADHLFSYYPSQENVAFHGEGGAVSTMDGHRVRVFAVGPDIIRIEVFRE
jgi:hypothetical protein